MILDLPYPPSVNHYWFIVASKRGGRKVLGKKGRLFREEVEQYKKTTHQRTFGPEERLSVRIFIHPPDRRKRDIDNILKPTLDALEHSGLFVDDSQIDELYAKRRDVRKGGMVKVLVSAYKELEIDDWSEVLKTIQESK